MKILITGGSSGIGLSLANRFFHLGHEVHITSRNAEKLMLSPLKNKFTIHSLNLCSTESIHTFACQLQGNMDILINCAGSGIYGPLTELSRDQMRKQFEINLFGTLELISKLRDKLIHGKIVNVSSISPEINLPFGGIYSASKSALNTISEILRLELSPFDIQVITLKLGLIKTAFIQNAERVEIKADSPYKKFEQIINERSNIKNKMTDPDDLAVTIVEKLMRKKSPSIIYEGAGSCFYPLIKKILPFELYQYLLKIKFKLNEK